jgi:hypothetical protein
MVMMMVMMMMMMMMMMVVIVMMMMVVIVIVIVMMVIVIVIVMMMTDDFNAIDYCDDDKVMIMYFGIRLHLQLVRVFYYHINLFVKCYCMSCIEATLCITEIILLVQLKMKGTNEFTMYS